MKILLAFLINGFLFSITPSTVTDNKCVNPSPVIKQEKCDDEQIPVIQPELPQGSEKQEENQNKQVKKGDCPQAQACA